jgi:hypothetical protein
MSSATVGYVRPAPPSVGAAEPPVVKDGMGVKKRKKKPMLPGKKLEPSVVNGKGSIGKRGPMKPPQNDGRGPMKPPQKPSDPMKEITGGAPKAKLRDKKMEAY